MNIYILGAAGWIPGANETSCIMVENKGQLFILDAGTGLSNIRKYAHILDKYDTVHLLLSHYHLDHMIADRYHMKIVPAVIGLEDLPRLWHMSQNRGQEAV